MRDRVLEDAFCPEYFEHQESEDGDKEEDDRSPITAVTDAKGNALVVDASEMEHVLDDCDVFIVGE